MAGHDPINDPTPKLNNKIKRGPSVGELRTALQTANAGYYTNTRLEQMTKNDMIYAAKINSVVVPSAL